jgi:carbon starvation protein CstA
VLWRYFAWSNQTLAVFTLWASTVYLARHKRCFYITLLPAMFMTVVCTSYLLIAPSPEGFGLNYNFGIGVGLTIAAIFTAMFARFVKQLPGSNPIN